MRVLLHLKHWKLGIKLVASSPVKTTLKNLKKINNSEKNAYSFHLFCSFAENLYSQNVSKKFLRLNFVWKIFIIFCGKSCNKTGTGLKKIYNHLFKTKRTQKYNHFVWYGFWFILFFLNQFLFYFEEVHKLFFYYRSAAKRH